MYREGHDGVVALVDPHYLSFIGTVLSNIRKKGLGLLGMKTNAMGPIRQNGIATIPDCLRFARSRDVDTVVSGVETVQQLEVNVQACETFTPMSKEEITSLSDRTKKGETGSKVEGTRRKKRTLQARCTTTAIR